MNPWAMCNRPINCCYSGLWGVSFCEQRLSADSMSHLFRGSVKKPSPAQSGCHSAALTASAQTCSVAFLMTVLETYHSACFSFLHGLLTYVSLFFSFKVIIFGHFICFYSFCSQLIFLLKKCKHLLQAPLSVPCSSLSNPSIWYLYMFCK